MFFGSVPNVMAGTVQMEQGVPVAGDGIQVGVDPFNGRIVSCYFSWHTGVTFPSPVTVAAAKKTGLLDQFGVIPCYVKAFADGGRPWWPVPPSGTPRAFTWPACTWYL